MRFSNLKNGPDPISEDEEAAYAKLELGWFREQNLLPQNKLVLAYKNFPTPDFANMATVTHSLSKYKNVSSTNVGYNAGWDLGGTRSKVLIVFGGMKVQGFGSSLFVSEQQPAGTEVVTDKTYLFDFTTPAGPANASFAKFVSSVYTQYAGGKEQQVSLDTGVETNPMVGMAFYRDDSGGILKAFLRFGTECWWPVCETSGVTDYTGMVCAGFRFAPGGGGEVHFAAAPVAVYAE